MSIVLIVFSFQSDWAALATFRRLNCSSTSTCLATPASCFSSKFFYFFLVCSFWICNALIIFGFWHTSPAVVLTLNSMKAILFSSLRLKQVVCVTVHVIRSRPQLAGKQMSTSQSAFVSSSFFSLNVCHWFLIIAMISTIFFINSERFWLINNFLGFVFQVRQNSALRVLQKSEGKFLRQLTVEYGTESLGKHLKLGKYRKMQSREKE